MHTRIGQLLGVGTALTTLALAAAPLVPVSAATTSPGLVVAFAGDPTQDAYNQNALPAGLNNVVAISDAGTVSAALESDGTVISWGDSRIAPVHLAGMVAVSTSDQGGIALRPDGTNVAWGSSLCPHTPDGSGIDFSIPGPYFSTHGSMSGARPVAVRGGGNHCYELLADGTVVAAGDDYTGATDVPAGLSGVKTLSDYAGGYMLALRYDGTVVGWGDDGGQPVPSSIQGHAVAIASGTVHGLALRDDGTVVAWGGDFWGQTNVPAGLSNVVAIAAGFNVSVALKADGTLVAWGLLAGLSGLLPRLTNVEALSTNARNLLALVANPDTSAPTTTATLSPAPNAAGWNNSNVSVGLSATDPDGTADVASVSYSASGSQPIAATTAAGATASFGVGAEGATTIAYYATDQAGNQEAAKTLTVRIDKTAPSVSYTGNAGFYSVDQSVSIACNAADPVNANGTPGSGLASTTCGNIAGPAYSFKVGINTFTASATDVAGNVGQGSVSFTVTVDYASLCRLTAAFVEASPNYSALPPTSQTQGAQLVSTLCAYLNNVVLAPAQKAELISAYQLLVGHLATTGWLTQSQAATLVSLSNDL